MSPSAYVLAVDQGTTGSRSIVYDSNAVIISSAYQEFPQIFPKSGWVEHDAEEIWRSVQKVIRASLRGIRRSIVPISAIGITNQRETSILWDRRSGRPLCHAIVWQDRRTAVDCERLRAQGHESMVRRKTGLVLDPYFSATKIAWMLKNISGLAQKTRLGNVLFGTVDTWLLWKLTNGKIHSTDPSNASRTLLFNIHTRQWDDELLKIFKIPRAILPEVRNSGSLFGVTACGNGIPTGVSIHSLLGDQQAALYGQACYSKGDIKNTYGTGCFTVMNLGKYRPREFPRGLLGTLASDEAGNPVYALEGSVFMGGAVIQWLRDGLKLIKKAAESGPIALNVKSNGGVTIIPAFTGLGSPYWKPEARALMSGMTRGTTAAHIIRAALESIAHQSADVIDQMEKTGMRIKELKVDGGASGNHFLMQFQADILQIPIWVSSQSEATAWGTASLAGKSFGIWDYSRTQSPAIIYRKYFPRMKSQEASMLRSAWAKEIERALY